jgi:hypothetical protein
LGSTESAGPVLLLTPTHVRDQVVDEKHSHGERHHEPQDSPHDEVLKMIGVQGFGFRV